MKRAITLAVWLVYSAAPALAQSPATAPAVSYATPTSTLSSLFGRYTIQGDFAVKDPKEWVAPRAGWPLTARARWL